MEKKLDLRVRRTRQSLTSALYELMCQKSLDEITVTELCERAVVRKATFYKHFGDKSELLVYMIRELQRSSIEENAICYDPALPYTYYSGAFQYLVAFIDSNERFVASVLRSDSSALVRGLLEEQIRLEIDAHMRQESRADVRASHSMLSAVYAGAIVSCCVWWVNQDKRLSKEQLTRQFAEFIRKL